MLLWIDAPVFCLRSALGRITRAFAAERVVFFGQ